MENTCPAPQGPSLAKRLTCLGIALIIILAGWLLPAPDGLSFEGKMALSLMVAGIFLWVTEPVPVAVSGLVIMVSLPAFGILPFLNATDPATGATTIGVWGGFISNVIFFILASFGITAALLKTKIPAKIVFALLQLTRGNSRATIGAFMVAAAILSFLISDLPCTALFTGIAVSSILKVQGCACGSSNLGKALMIGITYASVVGGQAIPSGSAMNVMAMNVLTAHTGISISFLGWTSICLPIALVLIVFCWISVVLVFKPEPIAEETRACIERQGREAGRLEALDWKVIAIIAFTFVLWVASNWTGWDITAIAILCLALFFVPGIDVLTWKEYVSSVSWNIVLLIGCVQSIAGGIKQQGAASWLFSSTVGKLGASAGALIAATAVVMPLLHLIIPVGPALIAISIFPLAGMAPAMGVSAAVFAIIIAYNANASFLLGVDSNNMMTFKYGQWTMKDFFIAGIIPTIAMILLHSFALAPLVALVGY